MLNLASISLSAVRNFPSLSGSLFPSLGAVNHVAYAVDAEVPEFVKWLLIIESMAERFYVPGGNRHWIW